MKKRILMLLCAAVLAISIAAPPALAAGGPFYPISVEEYTYGSFDELRINKVYQLSLSDDPSGIPTEDFERNGRRYFLLDMIREDEVGVDTQDYTDTITQDSDTNDLSAVLKQLDPHREVTTEDGYTGLLALDYTSVTVEAKGYKTSTKSLSATCTYPNLSDADHGQRQNPDPGSRGVERRREWLLHRHGHLYRHFLHPLRHRLYGHSQLYGPSGKDRLRGCHLHRHLRQRGTGQRGKTG